MNDEPRRLSIDSELEARLVAMVLGEASDFERDELQRLIEKRPELAAFLEEMESVHALMQEVGAGDSTMPEDDWKLPEERRAKVIAAIEGRAVPDSSVRLAVNPMSETRDWSMIMRRVMSVAALFMAVGLIGWLLLIPGYTENTVVETAAGFVPMEEVEAEFADNMRYFGADSTSDSNGVIRGFAAGGESMGRSSSSLSTEGAFIDPLYDIDLAAPSGANSSSQPSASPQSALADIRASLGVEAESAAPATLPSPYYLQDDVQYFPSGPEFKLSREAAALRAARSAEAGEQVPQSGESDGLGLDIAGSSQPAPARLSLPSVNFVTPEDTRLSESRSASEKGEAGDGNAVANRAAPAESGPTSKPWGATGVLPDPSVDLFVEPSQAPEFAYEGQSEGRVRSRFAESFKNQSQSQGQQGSARNTARGEERFDRQQAGQQPQNEQLLAQGEQAGTQGVTRGLSLGSDVNKKLGDVDVDGDGLDDAIILDSLPNDMLGYQSFQLGQENAKSEAPIIEPPAAGAMFGMIGGMAGEADFGGVTLDDKMSADGGVIAGDTFGAVPSTGGVAGVERMQSGGEIAESARSGFQGGGGFGGGGIGGMGPSGGGIGGQASDMSGLDRAGGGAIVQNGSTGRPLNRSGNGDVGSGPVAGKLQGGYGLPSDTTDLNADGSGEEIARSAQDLLQILEADPSGTEGIANRRTEQKSLERGQSAEIAAIDLPTPSNQPLAISGSTATGFDGISGLPSADSTIRFEEESSSPELSKRFRSKFADNGQLLEGEPADETDEMFGDEVEELQERLSKLSSEADKFSKQRQLLREEESESEDLMAGVQIREQSNESMMSFFDAPSREPSPTPAKPQSPSSDSLFSQAPTQLQDLSGGAWSTKINREWLESLPPAQLPENEKASNGRDFGRDWLRQQERTEFEIALSAVADEDKAEGIASLDGEEYGWRFRGRVDRKAKAKKAAPPAGLKELSASEEAFSTFSLFVSDVSFKLSRAALAGGSWPEADKVRIEEFVNAFDYGDPMPSQREKVACQIEQAAHPFLQQRNLMRVSMRTAAAGRSGNTPLRLTLLVDNSGSMDRLDRQQTMRRAFAALAQQLQPIDQVTLISFARQPRLLADQVSGANANQLFEIIRDLPSEGGTNIEAALQLAFEKAVEQKLDQAQNRIILLTDGAVNLGDANPNSLSRMITTMRSNGIAFDAAGISAEGLNDEVLEALTRKGDGRYYLLDSLEAVEDGFARQIAGALRPAAKNVKVQVQFNPDRVGQYKLLGFEKHRLKKEDFRNDKVDAAEMAAEEAGVAVYQFEAKPDGDGDIGMVSVRFRDLSTGLMVEKTWPIPYEADAPRLDQASASLRVAGSAALLATKLKGEAMAETVDLKTLSGVVSEIPPSSRNQRVDELQQMIQQARQLSP